MVALGARASGEHVSRRGGRDTGAAAFAQELRGETWGFSDKVVAWDGPRLIGGVKELIAWARDEHGFTEFRPLPLYQLLQRELYVERMQRPGVSGCQ